MTDENKAQQMGANGRDDAIQDLIKSLQTRYPQKGFMIHPSITFCTSQSPDSSGMMVVANTKITKDQNLLVIPFDTNLEAMIILDDNELRSLQRSFEKNRPSEDLNMSTEEFKPEDIFLAVAIMRILASKTREDDSSSKNANLKPFSMQAATWPSTEEMMESSLFYWDESKVEQVWNHSGLFDLFTILRKALRQTFETTILPVLTKKGAEEYIDPSLPSNQNYKNSNQAKDESPQKLALWNTFLYAFSLVWSRSHEGKFPKIVPLVDLFNGNSVRIDQSMKRKSVEESKLTINVDFAKGQWPFIKGRNYVNDGDLACSTVYATRDIEEGEELILSYGDLTPLQFMFKYGTIPKDLLCHHDIISNISIFCKPKLVPDDGTLQAKCLGDERAGYPLDDLKSNEIPLCELSTTRDEMEAYRNGHGNESSNAYNFQYMEPEGLTTMRQFLILSRVANDQELHTNYTSGRLRVDCDWQKDIAPLLVEMIDYNLEKLSPNVSSSDKDIERIDLPDVPSWEKAALTARVVYRENLLMWRYTVGCVMGRNFLQPNRERIPLDMKVQDGCECYVCGRRYPLLRCSRCKEIQYCSRAHQASDWKTHKLQCKKS